MKRSQNTSASRSKEGLEKMGDQTKVDGIPLLERRRSRWEMRGTKAWTSLPCTRIKSPKRLNGSPTLANRGPPLSMIWTNTIWGGMYILGITNNQYYIALKKQITQSSKLVFLQINIHYFNYLTSWILLININFMISIQLSNGPHLNLLS